MGKQEYPFHTTFPQYDGRDYWTSIIQAEVYTKQSLNQILIQGKHPCWVLDWHLKEDIDLDRLVSEVKDRTNRTPSSSTMHGASEGNILGGTEYSFDFDNQILRIYLGRGGYSGARATIGLRYEGNGNEGFFRAHEIISPDSILSFLQGDLSFPKFRSMINEAKNLLED
jgi:hypothetical protein